jgi:hypothetical protein
VANQQASVAVVEIESEHIYQDIRRLGHELRASPERAVALAIAEKLARIRAEERVKSGLADQLHAMIKETARMIPADAGDPAIDLYDANGMPG